MPQVILVDKNDNEIGVAEKLAAHEQALLHRAFSVFIFYRLKNGALELLLQQRHPAKYHCGGLWTEGKHPKNVGSFFGYIEECQYLNGVIAGHMSKSGKIGFVAAKPIPQVLRNINAFLLGARSVKPGITCSVIFTGEWSMSIKEAEATNSLADQGVDVFTMHVDGPKVVVETAAKHDIRADNVQAGYRKGDIVDRPAFQ